jgi:hypothetical protein
MITTNSSENFVHIYFFIKNNIQFMINGRDVGKLKKKGKKERERHEAY